MNKQDHIKHWVETCQEDWLSAHDLFQTKRFLQCLFFAHLTIEKLSKAHWVKDNSTDIPPRTHNILRLWQDTHLQPSADLENTAVELNNFQMDGRYQDYQRASYQRATEAFTRALLDDTDKLRQWLLSNL
ncbi:HEPN domain-containing protein [Hymenobacter weizhouensis]|uniref:HEPN domain-containing protein n=1 Tax=Hymenobacter sp. YIM 151500-1 TaxID=2987689 RepID=UPI002225B70B|nr:HEPN domain-containing protein [Hymenobacter sp. YIM 151500-1]UYZ62623.1 HEPN domain-containing protein [Hymenobacter sp. YIM 151500-1]